MTHTVIPSQVFDTKCWSAKRFLNECHSCNRVLSCELPTATFGRIVITRNQINELEDNIKRTKETLVEKLGKVEALLEANAKELAG